MARIRAEAVRLSQDSIVKLCDKFMVEHRGSRGAAD